MSVALEELRERLGGAYDLEDVGDCHRVMELLVRDADDANAREREAREKLRVLATKVLNLSPGMRDEARRSLSPELQAGDAWGFISEMASQMDGAGALSDEELVDNVLDKVWSGLDMNKPESALLGELVDRFKRRQEKQGGRHDSSIGVQDAGSG